MYAYHINEVSIAYKQKIPSWHSKFIQNLASSSSNNGIYILNSTTSVLFGSQKCEELTRCYQILDIELIET